MKKLILEELSVESFVTEASEPQRGTVVGNEETNETFCCETAPYRTSCSPDMCTNTTGGTTSEGSICYTAVGCSENSCTGPYGCGCTKTESFDYTFCMTMCC